MQWPQITLIVLIAMTGTLQMLMHGNKTEHHFAYWAADTCILIALLHFGGFWK